MAALLLRLAKVYLELEVLSVLIKSAFLLQPPCVNLSGYTGRLATHQDTEPGEEEEEMAELKDGADLSMEKGIAVLESNPFRKGGSEDVKSAFDLFVRLVPSWPFHQVSGF